MTKSAQEAEGKTVLPGKSGEDGFQDIGGGKFAPFALPEVGEIIQGEIVAVRETERKRTDKKGRVVETNWQIMLDVRLTVPGEYFDKGEEKGGVKRSYKSGDTVCFPSKTIVDNRLVEIVTRKTGEVLDEDEEVRAKFLQPLVGEEIRLSREADGTIKEGPWKGKPSHMYKVGWKAKDAGR